MINFDANATVPMLPCVAEAIRNAPVYNSHSLHIEGTKARNAEIEVEFKVKQAIGADNGQVFWFGSGSLANYFATHETLWTPSDRHNRFICSNIEHQSLYQDVNLVFIQKDHVTQVERHDFIGLASLMLVNNETGLKQPVRALKNYYPDAVKHTDAVQALGKIPINAKELGVDMVTLSAHKIGGPKGLGCLWVREGIDFKPPYLGTAPTELIYGFGRALDYIDEHASAIARYINVLDHELITYLQTQAQCNVHYTTWTNRVRGTFLVTFPGIDSTELILLLGDKGILVSRGSACNKSPSHVMKNMGFTEEEQTSTIRISIHHSLSREEAEEGIVKVIETVKELTNGH